MDLLSGVGLTLLIARTDGLNAEVPLSRLLNYNRIEWILKTLLVFFFYILL